jgi:hypothetical protein
LDREPPTIGGPAPQTLREVLDKLAALELPVPGTRTDTTSYG